MSSKKILILAYDFPPYSSVGAQRPYSLLLHFQKFGIRPTVVTRIWPESVTSKEATHYPTPGNETMIEKSPTGTIIRAPFKGNKRDRLIAKFGMSRFGLLRRILTLFYSYAEQFSLAFDAKSSIYYAADKAIKEEKPDIILATGEPFILFRYASLLSKKHNIPWIADYRDGWSTNHTTQDNPVTRKFKNYLERKYTRNALFFTSVSDNVVEQIASFTGKKGYVIPNGVELDLIKDVKRINKKFSIVYTGILYNLPYVDHFVSGFKQFVERHRPDPEMFEVLLVGIELNPNSASEKLFKLAEEYPQWIQHIKRVSAQKATEYQVNASILLSFIAGSQANGLFGAKTYSYAATRVPILVIPNEPGTDTTFFPGRDIQLFAFSGDEVCNILEDLYTRYLKGGSIFTSITDDEIYSISREYHVGQLSAYINQHL